MKASAACLTRSSTSVMLPLRSMATTTAMGWTSAANDRDGRGFVVVEDLEVFLLEVGHETAVGVEHRGVDRHRLDGAAKDLLVLRQRHGGKQRGRERGQRLHRFCHTSSGWGYTLRPLTTFLPCLSSFSTLTAP